MLVIRFFRVGKKNQPSFKVVVADKRNAARAGRSVEEVGFYNPSTNQTILKKERIQYWISKGAQPSPTVHNLLIKEGFLEGKKIAVHKKSKKPLDAAQGKSAEAPAPAAPPPAETPTPAAPAAEPPKAE